MILFHDLNSRGKSHSAFNSMLTRMLMTCDPELTVIADKAHAQELRADNPELDVRADISSKYQRKTPLRSILKDTLQACQLSLTARRLAASKIVVSYPSSTSLLVLRLMRRLKLVRGELFLLFHGNLSEVSYQHTSWLWRTLSFTNQLQLLKLPRVKGWVLEPHIRSALATQVSAEILSHIQVLPHPYNPDSDCEDATSSPSHHNQLIIGFFGTTTKEKGFGEFLQIARELNNKTQFWAVGQGSAPEDNPLNFGPSHQKLDYCDYVSRLNQVDLVFFCQIGDYYNYSASGTLLDFAAQEKLIIGLNSPIIQEIEQQHGPIGWFFDSVHDLVEALKKPEQFMPTSAQYQERIKNVQTFKQSRHVKAINKVLRQLLGRNHEL